MLLKKVLKKWLTIAELLIVITIIAILALTVFIYFWEESMKARNAVRIDTLNKVRDVMYFYQNDHWNFPKEWTNDVVDIYVDNQEPWDNWYESYSTWDLIFSKNSNFDKTIWGWTIWTRINWVLEDPTSTYSSKVYYKYWTNYSWFYWEEKFIWNKFEIATVLEEQDGSYENYVLNNFIEEDDATNN